MEKRFVTKIYEVDSSVTSPIKILYPVDVKLIPSCLDDSLGILEVNTYWSKWCSRHLSKGIYEVRTHLTRSKWVVSEFVSVD